MVVFYMMCLMVAASSEAVAINTLTSNLGVLRFKPFSCVYCLGFWMGLINMIAVYYLQANHYDLESSLIMASLIGMPFFVSVISRLIEKVIYE